MSSYENLAEWYDQLTGDVPYGAFADFYEAEFDRCGGQFRLLLDLGCGTGTLCCEMAKRGYELIAVDPSVDMLMQAQSKSFSLDPTPLFVCQSAGELDLFGTVDAAYSSLDAMNYINPQELREAIKRLAIFIRPGGLFVFDIRPPEWLRAMDGQLFVDESDDVLCLWRADFDSEINALIYGMDIFSRKGQLWQRSSEEHIEYAHDPLWLKSELEERGFSQVRLEKNCPQGDSGRMFIIARR